MEKNKREIPLVRLITGGVLLILGVAGWAAARNINGFADFYGFNIYPIVVNIFARVSGIFPFSVGEIMVISGVLLVIFAVVYFIVNIIKRKGRRLIFLLSSFSTVLLVGSLILFAFVYGSGINYSRRPFSKIAGLETGKYTKEQVLEVLTYAISNVAAAGENVQFDGDGHVVIPDDLSGRAISAMQKLGGRYPSLDSFYPRVKPVMLSELMCYGHITGIFSFYSMEANYNTLDVPEQIGHTFCHELSHMTGFMREDEANFISYLACRDSGDAYLTYSGWYDMAVYLLNAYASSATRQEYAAVYYTLPDYVIDQLHMQNEFWDKYETDFGEAAEVMNDVYLKINDQSDGTKSYGRVVDLAIADYYNNIYEG